MAENDTTLSTLGPGAAQLKTNLTALEKTQINSIKNYGGGLSAQAGVINGDVSKSLTQISPTQRSMMELGADIAAKMERAGTTQKVAEESLRPGIISTVTERNRLHERFPTTQKDLRIAANRNPSNFKKNPKELIKESKDRLLGEEDFNYNGEMFPMDLKENAAAYVELWFKQYTRTDAFSEGKVGPSKKFYFPVPENLSIGYNVKYEERDTGILGEIISSKSGRDAIKNIQDGNFAALGDQISAASGEDVSTAMAQVANRAAFAALNSASDVVGGLAGQIKGSIPNPHPTVFFKGLDLREFTWTWKFVPRSEAEAAKLTQMLQSIRKLILPESKDGFLKYPYLLKPSIMSDANALDIYGKFKNSAVKQFLINYTGEGTSAFFYDGNPVAINCQMTFQEVEMYTSADA